MNPDSGSAISGGAGAGAHLHFVDVAMMRRAWLQELGVEWRGPLPEPLVARRAEYVPSEPPVPEPQAPGREEPPPTPPVDEPPSGPAPVDEPPVAPQPVEEPPPHRPPLSPPADVPPGEPPYDEPPREDPPAQSPPDEEPPLAPPPVQEPPRDSTLQRPAALAAARAMARRQARVQGAWRWSWWQASSAEMRGPAQALLLRPAEAPRETDARARDLLAAAMQAVGLQPVPRRDAATGGLWRDGVELAWLHEQASQRWQEAEAMPVIWCLPVSRRALLTTILEQPHAVPGTRWLLAGTPPLQLVLVPAPEDMLLDAALKRVAWQALAPLRR